MSDVDEELLALAGDSSSDEEDAPMNISRDSSAEPNGKDNKQSTRRANHDSEEEGEASSRASSPRSQKSAPMDESDSESDAGDMYEQGELFPYEGKFTDAADKAEIMAMPEIKREEILAERAQQQERDRQNRALRQLMLHRNAREAGNKDKSKKRKAATALDDESQRKTSRQRTKVGGGRVGEASSGIDSLKRARAEKKDRQTRRQEDKDRHGDRTAANGAYSEGEESEHSEVEWDDPKQRRSLSPVIKDALPADLRDVERVRVGRSQFALVCFYPGFETAITGCFVRVNVGASPDTGATVYRMGIIKGFEEGKPYALETANGKKFVTNQYVLAAHGKATKPWPFMSCSNQPFSEAEFQKYTQTCRTEDVPISTKPKLISKISDINALVNRTWTEAELQEKLNRSGALKNKFAPIERTRLQNLLRTAQSTGDEAQIARLQIELEALDGPKLAYGTSMQRNAPANSGPKEVSQQERLAQLNRENRRKNAEEVRQAQIKERRTHMAIEAAIARGETIDADHSRRLKTRAKFKHDAAEMEGKKSSAASGTSTPLGGVSNNGSIEKNGDNKALFDKLNADKKGRPIFKRQCDDDIIGAIDLGIDINI